MPALVGEPLQRQTVRAESIREETQIVIAIAGKNGNTKEGNTEK